MIFSSSSSNHDRTVLSVCGYTIMKRGSDQLCTVQRGGNVLNGDAHRLVNLLKERFINGIRFCFGMRIEASDLPMPFQEITVCTVAEQPAAQDLAAAERVFISRFWLRRTRHPQSGSLERQSRHGAALRGAGRNDRPRLNEPRPVDVREDSNTAEVVK